MAYKNHNNAFNEAGELTVYELVLNRLTFLDPETEGLEKIISNFTLEVMNELEPCFRIANQVDPPNPARIGDEQYYSTIQKSIIADIVSVYFLMREVGPSVTNSSSSSSGGSGGGTTYLKKAKAGSVEVEYGVASGGSSSSSSSSSASFSTAPLVDLYKKNAINKAANLGCIIDVCNDCSIQFLNASVDSGPAFFAPGGCAGCGC